MMKVLIVAAYNKQRFAPFIIDQAEALSNVGVKIDFFGIVGHNVTGYFQNRKKLIRKIEEYNPQIIHAHYGLSGLLANLQRKVPVVTTYHGSDINNAKVFLFSKICLKLSSYNIFVSEKIRIKAGLKQKQALIPCGIDTEVFKPTNKTQARAYFGFSTHEKLILFSSAFNNKVKNVGLALDSVKNIPDVRLLELVGYSREEVALLMNAVDAVLLTSFTEGSPQFIKEAMACNCPIVSVDVGDVKDVVGDTDNCFICPYDSAELQGKLSVVLNNDSRTNGQQRIVELGLDSNTIAKRIEEVYEKVLFSKKKN